MGWCGFDESTGSREGRKVFIFSDCPREREERECMWTWQVLGQRDHLGLT